MNTNHIQAIENFGLNEKEALVYLALLELGKASANGVSRKSGLKRPTTYVILEQLMQKGFVYKIPRARKHIHAAIEPDKCAALAKEKLNFALDFLPELKALQKGKIEKTSISYFEGLEGFKEAYGKILKNKEGLTSVAFYAYQENISPELKKYWEELEKMFEKRNIKRKIIIPQDASTKEYIGKTTQKNEFIELKTLSADKFMSDVSIEVYDNLVLLASHKYMQASLIEDADVAKTMTQIFELVWQSGE